VTHTETVDPGHELVLVDRPYFFGHEGVRDKTVKEGRVFLWSSTQAIDAMVAPQSREVAFDDIASKDNILLDFSTTVQYEITDPVKLVRMFGTKWFENNLLAQYSTIVRQAVKARTMGELMSDATTTAVVDQYITEQTIALVDANQLPIRILNITLGRAKPNDEVLQQMNETAREQQRNKTLQAAIASEQSRAESERLRAQADDAYRKGLGMDAEQFVRVQIGKMYSDACKSAANCIITTGQSNVLVPAK